jgi:ATP-dependent Lon protease
VEYLETGHMRPVLFVGEKGCGKTTAVRLLVEEALHLPTEVIKVPQTDGSHGMTGDNGSYQSADAGCIAKARLRADNLLVAYVFDEIDKVTHGRNHASVDDELLSITDESCSEVYDNYLETTLVGLEHCPMFMTANDLQQVSPILADRCTVILFPNADAVRIKSISRKYANKKLTSRLYRMIRFDYELMDTHIDNLVRHNVTSLRKHQQMIEAVLENALNVVLIQESEAVVRVTEEMFVDAEQAVLGTVKRRTGF